MSLETIKIINQAEDAAKEVRASAQLKATQMLHEAQEKSAAAVEDAVKRANDEVRQLLAAADVKAAEKSEELRSGNENRQAAMRARAQARMDTAAQLIVERIVSS